MSKHKELQNSKSVQVLLAFAMMVIVALGTGMKVSAKTVTLNLEQDASYTSSQLSGYTSINLNGHKLTVTDDFVTKATIKIDTNAELIVKGDMTTSNNVTISKGTLNVLGNYKQTAGRIGGAYAAAEVKIGKSAVFEKTGDISFSSSEAKVSIGSNLTFTSRSNVTNNNAEWTIGGNLTQGKDAGSLKMGALILDGKNKTTQVLTFQSKSDVKSLNAKNPKVKIVGYLNGGTLESDLAPEMDTDLKSTGLNLNGHKLTLPHGLEVDTLNLGIDGNLYVNGDLITTGKVTCTKAILTVTGNYIHTNGYLYSYDKCNISVKKNMTFENLAYINLSNGRPEIIVGGNLVYSSEKDCPSNQGDWTVAGNITQTKGSGFYKAGNLILNGKKLQTLTFQENSKVPTLNAKNSQIKLVGHLNDTALYSDFSPKMDGDLTTTGLTLRQFTMVLPHGLKANGNVYLGLNGKLVVNGDMTIGGKMDATHGILDVKGNYKQTSGSLYIYGTIAGSNGTRMIFGKDVTFVENGYIYSDQTNVKADIAGSLYYKSNAKSSSGGGEWTIGKNLIQDKSAASFTLKKVILPNKGSKVTVTSGTIKQLVLYYPKDNYTISLPDNKTTISLKCTMKFNVNGGTGKFDNVTVYTGENYGTLPKPTRAGYTFDGWYTKAEGGTKISTGDVIKATKDFTVYAHWNKSKKYKEVTEVFTDVNKGDWFVKAVQFVYDEQIMSGTSATTFTPNGNLTRGQFVTVLYNLAGKPTVKFKNEFSDVKENDYFASAVMWAYKNGITSGVGGGAFGPNLTITREQMAVMLYKYSNLIGYNTKIDKKVLDKYPDKKLVDSWALEGMQWAVTNKVINGKSTGTGSILDPLGKASRAECAQVILNFNDNVVKK